MGLYRFVRYLFTAKRRSDILPTHRQKCRSITTTGTSQDQIRQRMETTMSDTSAPTRERKNGLQKNAKPVLQPWDLITLPISRRGDMLLDLEHASREDFGAWVVWNGVPLDG